MTLPSRETTALWALVALVAVTFLTGGGAREDLLSLVFLRPLAMLALAAGVVLLPRRAWSDNRALILAALAVPAITALHLVWLPPALWHALPGRELAEQIDRAVGHAGAWRPLSLVPYRTVNALLAFTVPLAGLFLALAVPRRRLAAVVYVVLAAAVLSAVIGLLQTIGGAGNGFYFYRVTNEGSAVGLFANRNHNAVLLALAFPLIAATTSLLPGTAEQLRLREWGAAGFAVLMLPFLFATQSRAGLLLGAICLALAVWTYRPPSEYLQSRRAKAKFDPRLLFGAAAVVAVGLLSAIMLRTSAIQRLASLGRTDDELRFRVWGPIWRMVGDYFPFGSGNGTFVEAFWIGESDALLKPTFLNHAHNDWLEIVLTGGLPLLAAVLVGGFVVVRQGIAFIRGASTSRQAVLRRLGLVVVAVMALSSLYDYPLRVPSLALLFAVAAVWLAGREPAAEAADVGINPRT